MCIRDSVWTIGSWNNNNPWNADKTKLSGHPASYNSSYSNNDNFGCASFYQCVNLREIEFPTTLVYICSKAFGNCVKLTSVTIPEGVELLGNSIFRNCIYNHRTTKTNQKYPSVNL